MAPSLVYFPSGGVARSLRCSCSWRYTPLLASLAPCQSKNILREGNKINPSQSFQFDIQDFAGRTIADLPRTTSTQREGIVRPAKSWWVWEDLNFRPHPYQGCALTN
jgi:hypothetical protein